MIIKERQSTHVYRQKQLFSKEELENVQIVITHSDIVEDWYIHK